MYDCAKYRLGVMRHMQPIRPPRHVVTYLDARKGFETNSDPLLQLELE